MKRIYYAIKQAINEFCKFMEPYGKMAAESMQ